MDYSCFWKLLSDTSKRHRIHLQKKTCLEKTDICVKRNLSFHVECTFSNIKTNTAKEWLDSLEISMRCVYLIISIP